MGKRKELGTDSMGIQKTMRMMDYLGDGLGQLPLNIMSCLVGQLTYFYTEKVGLAAGMVATMLLLAKVADAFSDLIMGKIMDASNSKHGKCRPWFLRMIIPSAAAIILIFSVPRNAPSGVQWAYVLLTNIFLSAVVYTAVMIPYAAIMNMRTASSEERGKMGTVRAGFGYAAGMFITILLIPITNMLGGDQAAWIKMGVIFAVISAGSLFVVFKVSKETAGGEETSQSAPDEEDVPFAEGIRLLFQNKYWVLMLFANLCMNISYGLNGSSGTYYAKYILGNDNLVGLMGLVGLIPTFLGFFLTVPLTKKFGMTKTCMGCCVVGAVACFVRVFMPYNFMACLIGGGICSFANIPMMCLFGAMVNNCVEYNEWKFGKRILGMTNSASSFGNKIGSGIGGSLIGWLLAFGGYQAAQAVQPASVNTAIFTFSIYIPLALFIIILILLKMNDLEMKYPKILAELQERRMQKGE